MKRWQNISAYILGVILIIVMTSFSASSYKKTPYSKTVINFRPNSSMAFIGSNDVQRLLLKSDSKITEKHSKEINIKMLEQNLEKHSSIEKAEVFSTFKGEITIKVTQRKPIVRYISSLSAYYLDNRGEKMPLSSKYTAPVPLVSGSLRGQEKEVCDFFNPSNSKNSYLHWFNGLHIEKNGDWVLYSNIGVPKVIIGNPEHIDKKLKKLSIFYSKKLNTIEADNFESVNLKFQDQVICKRR